MSEVLMRSMSVGRALAEFARASDITFTIEGEPQSALLIFSEHAFLPVVAMRAEMDFFALMGRPLGANFLPSPESLFGASVQLADLVGDEFSVLAGSAYMWAARSVFNMVPGSNVECMPVYAMYRDGLLSHAQKAGDPSWQQTTPHPSR